ncbi:polyprenyl synthetase family protein [Micropruina sp.]|uniref:polyprenyl synthetase family protein n=1 Tax=Micropruina sp. TaxID=2737536 RepID=UPI0039E2526C
MGIFAADDPIGAPFRDAVGGTLRDFIAAQSGRLSGLGGHTAMLSELAAAFTAGGKRLRPAFCWWGHQAVAESTEPGPLLRAAASLDLLHVSALVHDDVMDASDVRRGLPAAHRQFERWHAEHGLTGSPEAFGRAGAILLGDLLLVWSMELFTSSGLPAEALGRGIPLLDAVRTEVTGGQFLDVVAQAEPIGTADLMDVVPRVVEFKTSRYTVIRPLQIGAALAGGSAEALAALAGYGSPLGRAFQFRDDVLGVFGEPEVTGKPAGDDLREGKRTVLVAHALQLASETAKERLAGLLGSPDLDADEVATAREIIVASGALAATERRIADDLEQALAALDGAPLRDEAVAALHRLAELSVARTA